MEKNVVVCVVVWRTLEVVPACACGGQGPVGVLGLKVWRVHGGPTLAQVTFHLTLNLSDPASAWTPMEDESNNQEERGISR